VAARKTTTVKSDVSADTSAASYRRWMCPEHRMSTAAVASCTGRIQLLRRPRRALSQPRGGREKGGSVGRLEEGTTRAYLGVVEQRADPRELLVRKRPEIADSKPMLLLPGKLPHPWSYLKQLSTIGDQSSLREYGVAAIEKTPTWV
jgi:hypothetical protein